MDVTFVRRKAILPHICTISPDDGRLPVGIYEKKAAVSEMFRTRASILLRDPDQDQPVHPFPPPPSPRTHQSQTTLLLPL